MKRIALISDTHSYLDPKIRKYLEEVDEIWHAGDIGSIEVLDELKRIKPTVAVYGNIDGNGLRQELKEIELFECEDVNVAIMHIAGKPGNYYDKALKVINLYRPGLFICGHSHILLVKFDPVHKMLHMNPGACGNHGFHAVKTLLRFSITGASIHDLEIIELGKR